MSIYLLMYLFIFGKTDFEIDCLDNGLIEKLIGKQG